jgi:glycosyltransferase involved in cell wall biosynthesis
MPLTFASMKIAVISRGVCHLNGLYHFIKRCSALLAIKHSNLQFVVVSADAIDIQDWPTNTGLVIIPQKIDNALGIHYWFNYQLPAAIKKIHPTIVLHTDRICCVKTKLPQITCVPHLLSSNQQVTPNALTKYVQKKQLQFLQKANGIITQTNIGKQDLIEKFALSPELITVIQPGVDLPTTTIDWQIQQQLKEKITNGTEYFLHQSDLTNNTELINLLKAFSLFKKRQKTNMKLVLLASIEPSNTAIQQSLLTYKYKDDVVYLPPQIEAETQTILLSAYAIIQTTPHNDNFSFYLTCMANNIPLLIANNAAANELLGEGVIYVDPNEVQEIANQLMWLFTNEQKRDELIAKASQQIVQYNWQHSADALWQKIQSIIPPSNL